MLCGPARWQAAWSRRSSRACRASSGCSSSPAIPASFTKAGPSRQHPVDRANSGVRVGDQRLCRRAACGGATGSRSDRRHHHHPPRPSELPRASDLAGGSGRRPHVAGCAPVPADRPGRPGLARFRCQRGDRGLLQGAVGPRGAIEAVGPPPLASRALPYRSDFVCFRTYLTREPTRPWRSCLCPKTCQKIGCRDGSLVPVAGRQSYRAAAPSPTTTNGAQKAGWASSAVPLSSRASIERRSASARPTFGSPAMSRAAVVINLTVASE